MNKLYAVLISGLALVSSYSFSQVSPEEANKLKTTLTPFGAERAGNAAGTIPAWDGGITQIPKGYQPMGDHVNPYAADKVLVTITKDNLAQHQDQLTPGQIALFNTYPDTFKMKIYPSRRSHSAPDWVNENTYQNALHAKLVEGGNGIEQAVGGIPFPIPKDGLEVIWNHIVRWRGVYANLHGYYKAVVEASGSRSMQLEETDFYLPFFLPNRTAEQNDAENRLFYYLAYFKAPARAAGGALLGHEYLNLVKQPREAWIYEPGTRRVRRSPELGYQTAFPGSKGQATVDDTDMYNGSPDRYDWKLVGKKEVYIPYNNYDIDNADLSYDQILTPGHMNPDYLRYELHRVWVVEANLKPGKRHIYKKRVFYIDEDSWSVAVADQYDGQDKLWRVSMGYLKNFYECPATWSTADSYHDLQSRRYYVSRLNNDQSPRVEFSTTPPDIDRFQPSALRRSGKR